ncbi:unnamed protein product [Gordionus sp. m RMFG-2023]|uniref:uncharacterized protein LOC135929870 n=1 Tax=Gordionus sp. m RMFG-2023 TaxID=3053472 RepID=UPI0030E0EABB
MKLHCFATIIYLFIIAIQFFNSTPVEKTDLESIDKFGRFLKNISHRIIETIIVIDIKSGNIEMEANYEASLDCIEFVVAHIFKSIPSKEKFIRIGLIQDNIRSNNSRQMEISGINNYTQFMKYFCKIRKEALAQKNRSDGDLRNAMEEALIAFGNRDTYKILIIFSDRERWNDPLLLQKAQKLGERNLNTFVFVGNPDINRTEIAAFPSTQNMIFNNFDSLYNTFFSIFKTDSDLLHNNTCL